ncbi:hypothetical protein [Jannaschia aquimarina]|nr:hypothetical protein [Jannaschia aquimarina]
MAAHDHPRIRSTSRPLRWRRYVELRHSEAFPTASLKITSVAALLAVGLAPGFAAAQSMSQGYDMLTTALASELDRIGVEYSEEDLSNLSLGQIAALQQSLDSGQSASNTRSQIETWLEDAREGN